jgi:Fe-S cluster assembly protein SufB
LAKTKFFIATNAISTEKAIALIVNGFSKEVLNTNGICCGSQKLLEISLEGSVGCKFN